MSVARDAGGPGAASLGKPEEAQALSRGRLTSEGHGQEMAVPGGRAWGRLAGQLAGEPRMLCSLLPGGPTPASWWWTGTGSSPGQWLQQRLRQGNKPKAYCTLGSLTRGGQRWNGEMALLTNQEKETVARAAPGTWAASGRCPGLTWWEPDPPPAPRAPALSPCAGTLLFGAGLGVSCGSCIPSTWLRVGLCKCC